MAGKCLLVFLLLALSSGKPEAESANGTLEGDKEEASPTNETAPSEAPSEVPSETPTEMPQSRIPGPRTGTLPFCSCDLHPGVCDLNCCCDSSCGSECSLGDPKCPFSFCLPGSTRAVSRVCLEESLIFTNNTPYPTEILLIPDGCDLLFCVQTNNPNLNYFQQPQMVTKANFPALSEQYGGPSFILPEQAQLSPPTAFYRVGDPIQILFTESSVLSVLKQPIGIGTSQFCTDENPAGFLESKSTSCIRIFTDLVRSCTADPALNAGSYYRDFSVLKVPVNMTHFHPLQVNIIPVSEPASPSLNGNTCHNVVSEVIYDVKFSGIHGIQKVSVQFNMINVSGNPGVTLRQQFSVNFWSRSSSSKQRSGNPGYIIGAPLIVLRNGSQQHITILQNRADGQCSATDRHKIRFRENMRTSCQFSIPFKMEAANCSHLIEVLYQAFQGAYSPGSLAITGNADTDHPEEWNSIILQKCRPQDEHCMVPVSLQIQVLWAQLGLRSNPQAQVLGARYYYLCKPLKFLGISMNMLPLTTVATFTDLTKWPDPPRGQPKVYWKLPFDFFFPFRVALSGAVGSSNSLSVPLLVTIIFYGFVIL